MKKRFEVGRIVLLCIAFAIFPMLVNVPLSLYGQEWEQPKWAPAGAVLGIIHLREGQDRAFVGVKDERDMSDACYAAWMMMPNQVIELIHPDPNVNPAIVRWMKQNNVNWAITFFYKNSSELEQYWVTRANRYDAGYSTLYYSGGLR